MYNIKYKVGERICFLTEKWNKLSKFEIGTIQEIHIKNKGGFIIKDIKDIEEYKDEIFYEIMCGSLYKVSQFLVIGKFNESDEILKGQEGYEIFEKGSFEITEKMKKQIEVLKHKNRMKLVENLQKHLEEKLKINRKMKEKIIDIAKNLDKYEHSDNCFSHKNPNGETIEVKIHDFKDGKITGSIYINQIESYTFHNIKKELKEIDKNICEKILELLN